ncbi:hypothetical protein M0R72_03340 [Candidatus Pacearchaeota archaeon]|jgi:hypothetical protein|nr:hypothetical protein [Candidatus Pacearchaeota archaeon]
MKLKFEILKELKEHIPFTLAATLLSVIIMSFLLLKENFISYAVSMFYIFHPMHILFSSIVSTAIFYNHTKKIIPAIIVSIFVSLFIGTLSDSILPYFGSSLFGIPISFHLPALENPILIFGASLVGASFGVLIRKTKFPHFLHVFISVFASLLYIFAYSTNFSMLTIFLIFIITSVSVIIPCCLSDIVFPMIFQRRLKSK